MVWLEVETKIPVKNSDVVEMRKRIRKIGKFVKKETRGDDYFALRRKFRRHGYPKKAFRIRQKPAYFEVNFKNWLKNLWSDDIIVKEEFEFKLKEKDEVDNLLALFKDLGFVQWMKKRKTSESYTHKKDKRLIIELNKVAHLGYFIEMEYLSQRHEMTKAKKKIRGAMKELGLTKKDVNNKGYTRALWDKGIKDKRYWAD
jgi:predicted adenylyl cyclase CyaB